MIKARSKKISILLVLAMLMTMFVGVGTASAATYSTSNVPTVSKADDQDLAPLIIDFGILNAGTHKAVIKLPDSFAIRALNTSGGAANAVAPGQDVSARVTDLSGSKCELNWLDTGTPAPPSGGSKGTGIYNLTVLSDNQLQFTVVSPVIAQEVKFGIILTDVDVPNSADAEIRVTIMKLDGDFSDGIITVGKTSGGALDVILSDPGTLEAGVSDELRIHVRQDTTGAFEAGKGSLKLKLPKGVTWVFSDTDIKEFPGAATDPSLVGSTGKFLIDITDDSVLNIERLATAGADKDTYTIITKINIDADEAVFGDIEATISGKSSVNMSSVKLGTYTDYGYTIKVDKPEKEVIAGRADAELSKFTIKENTEKSLIDGRTITIKLPDGVEFVHNSSRDVEAGIKCTPNIKLDNFKVAANDSSRATATIRNSYGSKGEIEIKDLKVKIAVDFTGDIKAQLSGSAGINDEVVLAKAVAPISAKADTKEVKIGVQGQSAGNITITENLAEAIMIGQKSSVDRKLTLSLPSGATWDKLPTVKVTEGDLEVDSVTRTSDKGTLEIKFKSQSSKPSTIEISDVVYTLDRTVPEGALKVNIGGTAVDDAEITNRKTAATVVAATVVTPAPSETLGNGEFKIGSNIYYVGGAAKVMDVAPYIKDNRTYVPMRYLGEILGAEVVWDDATRTVTLTRGDDEEAVFTIGSTSYIVNGETKTADVAPEITNSRTMLPARYVAEAFGAVVGWDPGTQTVLIQN